LGIKRGQHESQNDQDTIQDTKQDKQSSFLKFCMTPRSREEMQQYMGLSNRSHFMREYLTPLLDKEMIEMTLPDRPTSRNQRYITAEKGRAFLNE